MSDVTACCKQFPQLEGCEQTEIITKDGEAFVLFHNEPLPDTDRLLLENLTAKEILEELTTTGFTKYKLDEDTP